MSVTAQIRAAKGAYRLRDRIIAVEEELARAVSGESSPGGGPADGDVPRIQRQLAQLLRDQAELLDASPIARTLGTLPAPSRLREDADLLDSLASGTDEPPAAS